MPTLDQRLSFAARHIRTKEGKPFSLEGRDWVTDEFWGPCDSFKWWPIDMAATCDKCMSLANTITEWAPRNASTTEKHRATGCAGLELSPIILTVLALPRREGKTFNTAAYNLSTILLSHHKSITYMAAAGDQTKQLFHENYVLPIQADKQLRKACVIANDQVIVHSTNSFLECVPTSHSSVTGRGRSHIVVDEARDVGARVLTAFLPSVNANNGWECPRGHVHSKNAANGRTPKLCSACGTALIPWFGRIILMSSAGILDGGDKDWFADLVEKLENAPDKSCHLYRLTESTNPDVAKQSTGMMERVFGDIEATRQYIDVEIHNVSRRKGEDFVSSLDIHAVVDPRLANVHGSAARCVAFLDTSRTRDISSLVICSEEPSEDTAFERAPWERLVVERIDVWDPKKTGGVIDPAAILAHLDEVMPMFPALASLRVDTRVMPWAVSLVQQCQTPPPATPPARRGWGRKVEKFQGNTAERDASWNILEQRIMARSIRIPAFEPLIRELKGVRRKVMPSGRVEIRDRARENVHADIAEALAACCYLAHLQSLAIRSSLSKFVNRTSESSSLLDRLTRPKTAGLNNNSF